MEMVSVNSCAIKMAIVWLKRGERNGVMWKFLISLRILAWFFSGVSPQPPSLMREPCLQISAGAEGSVCPLAFLLVFQHCSDTQGQAVIY